MNLVVNARDAMPTGGQLDDRDGATSSSTRSTRAQHLGACRRAVRDARGRPTPASAWTRRRARRIFEPFFTTKARARAPGSACRRSTASSSRAAGTSGSTASRRRARRSSVYLPRTAAGRRQAPTTPVPARGRARGTETILLVEDEEQVRALARAHPAAARLPRARGARRGGRRRCSPASSTTARSTCC